MKMRKVVSILLDCSNDYRNGNWTAAAHRTKKLQSPMQKEKCIT